MLAVSESMPPTPTRSKWATAYSVFAERRFRREDWKRYASVPFSRPSAWPKRRRCSPLSDTVSGAATSSIGPAPQFGPRQHPWAPGGHIARGGRHRRNVGEPGATGGRFPVGPTARLGTCARRTSLWRCRGTASSHARFLSGLPRDPGSRARRRMRMPVSSLCSTPPCAACRINSPNVRRRWRRHLRRDPRRTRTGGLFPASCMRRPPQAGRLAMAEASRRSMPAGAISQPWAGARHVNTVEEC
jgi:hypothetical protein